MTNTSGTSGTSPGALPDLATVTLERDGHILLIGLNRPHKRNAFNQAMLADLARAYGLLVGHLGARRCAVRARRPLHRRSRPGRRRPQHRVREIAQSIAGRAAPLGVRATLASAQMAREQGDAAAIERLRPDVAELFGTADAAEGMQSFVERRQARFQGH